MDGIAKFLLHYCPMSPTNHACIKHYPSARTTANMQRKANTGKDPTQLGAVMEQPAKADKVVRKRGYPDAYSINDFASKQLECIEPTRSSTKTSTAAQKPYNSIAAFRKTDAFIWSKEENWAQRQPWLAFDVPVP